MPSPGILAAEARSVTGLGPPKTTRDHPGLHPLPPPEPPPLTVTDLWIDPCGSSSSDRSVSHQPLCWGPAWETSHMPMPKRFAVIDVSHWHSTHDAAYCRILRDLDREI